MKPLFPYILLLAGLTACAGISAPGAGNCRGGVCIKVTAVEPVRMEEPVSVNILVTTDKDISDLGISMQTFPPDVVVEGPQGWEKEAREGQVSKQGAGWKMTAKANQQTVFTRKVRFPSEEGLYSITVGAYTPTTGYTAQTLDIRLTRAGGTVYLSGTSVPVTPRPVPTTSRLPSPAFPTPTRQPYP